MDCQFNYVLQLYGRNSRELETSPCALGDLCGKYLIISASSAFLGNCSLHCSRLWHPASPYRVHPWTRISYIHV